MVRVHKNYEGNETTINAITHPVPHHADEVFATAMLATLLPVELLRTRDQAIIDSADAIIFDVGGEFDPKRKRFDHHQKGFSEVRPDGTIYSSAGLIWREYGAEIVKKLGGTKVANDEVAAEVVSLVDDALVRGIDARDNGQLGKEEAMTVSSVVANFNSLWDEDEDSDECFLKACAVAETILRREIKVAISLAYGQKLIADQIEATNGTILVMDRFITGWVGTVVSSDSPNATGLLYAVFPAPNGDWNVQAIPPDKDHMTEQRKPFPEGWRGLRGAELARVSDIKTAVFCHVAGFFAVANTREDAINLAKKAAETP